MTKEQESLLSGVAIVVEAMMKLHGPEALQAEIDKVHARNKAQIEIDAKARAQAAEIVAKQTEAEAATKSAQIEAQTIPLLTAKTRKRNKR